MAHPEQQDFCLRVKRKFPEKFGNCDVLDIGSLDINGNNQFLFDTPYSYTGLDICPGPNVHLVYHGHLYDPGKEYDIVISTECFEHDSFWKETILNAIRLTKKEGVFLFTCATIGRWEHGTSSSHPEDSPLTNGYYKNLTMEDILTIPDFTSFFSEYHFETNKSTADLYFYGIKR